MDSLLEKLKNNRDSILLAEIGAYLHDLGKARREFVEYYSKESEGSRGKGHDGHNFPSIFPEGLRESLRRIKVKVLNEEVTLMDFIEKHHSEKDPKEYPQPPRKEYDKWKDCEIPLIIRLLYARWNGYDGMDSGLDKRASKRQRKDYTFIATAFGYEFKRIELDKVDERELQEVIEKALEQYEKDRNVINLRRAVIEGTKKYYSSFLGETRRPANDVTLWDHSYSVATLVKCAIAKNIIDPFNASFDSLDFNWKILSINFDVLELLAKGVKLGDTLGYWKSILEAFKEAKEIVEVEYPIGNEIYRDTTGIYFLIPDIEIKELEKLVFEKLENIEPELMPYIGIKEIKITIDPNRYRFACKSPEEKISGDIKSRRDCIEGKKKEALKNALPKAREEALREIVYPTSFERFSRKFDQLNWENKEICPICRLRPMDKNSEGCEYCLERRKGRARTWRCNPKGTIWLDEISDQNDRVALVVGCFILDKWLDGSFIKTLAIRAEEDHQTGKIPIEKKNPSPARIRRCWETTERFIKSLESKLNNWQWGPDIRRQRVKFKIDPNPDITEGSTCDIEVGGLRFSPVCIDEQNGTFVSTINLELLKKFGKSADEISKSINEKEIKVKTEKDRAWKREKDGRHFKITEAAPADKDFQNYLPYAWIYSFPDQFMMLVPAHEALDIAEEILKEYEKEFSKVRDRLSLHLGIIAFHRKTPLYVVMDAGRRLIEAFRKQYEELGEGIRNGKIKIKVISIKDKEGDKEVEIEAKPYSHVPLKWLVSCSTGDPEVEDLWYPYIRIKNNCQDRKCSFDYTGSGDYVVHVRELRKDDEIEIEPSFSKVFYLENASDRFKVDENLRPLDDIHRIKNLWKKLKERAKSMSQIYAFWEEIKKRREYFEENEFKEFVKSSLINILEISPKEDEELFKELLQAVEDGLFDICLYWNLQVRKEKIGMGKIGEVRV
jgi:hypothetical protein